MDQDGPPAQAKEATAKALFWQLYKTDRLCKTNLWSNCLIKERSPSTPQVADTNAQLLIFWFMKHLHEHKQSRYLLSRSTYLRESFQPAWFFWSSFGYVLSPPQAGPARHFFHHRSCGWSSRGENVVSAEYDLVQKWNTHTWYHLICHWFSRWITLSQLRIGHFGVCRIPCVSTYSLYLIVMYHILWTHT